MKYTTNTSIKTWAEDDRPREKMLLKGKGTLSDAELLAILIGMGTRENSALDLAKIILQSVDHDLHKLNRLSIADLTKVKGIGPAKAITITAALELGRRKKETEKTKRTFLRNSRDVFEHLKPNLSDLNHEEFWIICLNRQMEVLKTVQISSGGVAGTVVDPKVVFKVALENFSSLIALAHNHPSGNPKPSQEDIKLTQKLKEAGRLLEIELLDHIIHCGENKYYSFADEAAL